MNAHMDARIRRPFTVGRVLVLNYPCLALDNFSKFIFRSVNHLAD